MELKELIDKIKNFRKTIISVDDYILPFSKHYLFENECIEYEGHYIFVNSDKEKKQWATKIMLNNIDYQLNIIDIELWDLKIKKPSEYNIICKELIPNLISTLNYRYLEYYPFGWEIEKHNQSMELKEDSIEKVELPEIELKKIKDKIAMLIELGIIEHLINKYPYLKANGLNALRLTKLLSPFLGIEVNSLKKIINSFVTDAKNSTDYPKITDKVKNVIDKLTLEK